MMRQNRRLSVVLVSVIFSTMVPLIGVAQSKVNEDKPKLASWVIGKKKEVVIVLHGGPCAEHTYLRPEFDRLKKVAKVIYYDQRGCGQSGNAKPYTWQEHVKDLHEIINAHARGRRVFLAGSSWGSALALLYGYCHPDNVKGLLLSGLFTWEGKGVIRPDRNRYRRDYRKVRRHRLEEHQLQKQRDAEGKWTESLVKIEKVATINYGPAMTQTRRSLISAPPFDSLSKIKLPLIVFNGDQPCSFVQQVKAYEGHFPNGTYMVIKGACHDPWFADPGTFFKSCLKFIRRHKKQSKVKSL